MRVNLNVELDEQLLKDILVTAVEGGSDYWASYTDVKRDPNHNILSLRVVEHEDHDGEGRMQEIVTPESIGRAIEKMQQQNLPYRHTHAVLTEDVDAETADVLLQIAVLGEIIYG